MFKSRTRVLVILVCFSFLLLCSTLVFCSQTQNIGGDVDVFYIAPEDFLTYELNSAKNGWIVTGYDESKRNGQTSLNIPDAYSLDDLTLPVTEIKASAFTNASVFESLTIGKNILKIGSRAFCDCTGLKGHLIIPDNVSAMWEWSFAGCSEITSLTIGVGVVNMGSDAFSLCSKLEHIYYNAKYANDISGERHSPFSTAGTSATRLTITIGDSVKYIPDYLFATTCVKILNVGKNVITVGAGAFAECSHLEEVNYNAIDSSALGSTSTWYPFEAAGTLGPGIIATFGDDVADMPNSLFRECEGLKTVIIGKNVKEIHSPFYKCSNIEEVRYKGTLKQWCEEIKSLEGVTKILQRTGSFYIDNQKIEGKLIIPNDVTKISNYAFYGRELITSVNFGSGVINIGSYAFQYCSNLINITLGDGLTNIGSSSLQGCGELNDVIIDSATIYANVSSESSSNGYLTAYIESGGTIKILQSIDDGSNTYLKDTSIFTKSTTTISGNRYNVYTKL